MQANVANHYALAHEWKRWVAENKMLGLDDAQIIEVLKQNGIDERVATQEAYAAATHPYFQAGEWMTQRLRKLESLLNIYRELSSLSSHFGKIERRRNVSQGDFLENYYAANRPVILLGLMDSWKARSLWNPEYLKAACGNEAVEIMSGRETDPEYEINSDRHKSTISFGEYVDMVTKAGVSNDFYLVANNHFLEKPGMRRLYDDIDVFPEYLDRNKLRGSVFFWFGPAGTITPLHHDTMNIFLAQVYGRKQITLISSDQTHLVYNDVAVYSKVDCGNPNYERYPSFSGVNKIEVVLEPGEVLFLPVGWWHYVKALDISITLTFINFLFPNKYDWNHPEIHR